MSVSRELIFLDLFQFTNDIQAIQSKKRQESSFWEDIIRHQSIQSGHRGKKHYQLWWKLKPPIKALMPRVANGKSLPCSKLKERGTEEVEVEWRGNYSSLQDKVWGDGQGPESLQFPPSFLPQNLFIPPFSYLSRPSHTICLSISESFPDFLFVLNPFS